MLRYLPQLPLAYRRHFRTGGITKLGTGAGALFLGSINSYTGATLVNEGSMIYGINGAIPAASALTIGMGQLLMPP